MWHSPSGTCSYIGPVADMIRRALVDLAGYNQWEGESYERWYPDLDAPKVQPTGMAIFDRAMRPYARMVCGVELYDDLVWNQKLVLLIRVGRAMLNQSEPAPPRTAVLDATAVASFNFISYQIYVELKTEELGEKAPDTYRQLGYRMMEQCADFLYDWPGEPCDDDHAWHTTVHHIQQQFFVQDRYVYFPGDYLDADPDETRKLLADEHLPPDYFTAIAPEPTESETRAAIAYLQSLADAS